MNNRQQQRQQLRHNRHQLSKETQQQQAEVLLHRISQCDWFQQTQHIACYQAHDGECDPSLICRRAWQLGKSCYLPISDSKLTGHMYFVPYQQDTELHVGAYGILEPMHPGPAIEATALDLVLVPLLGFDPQGHRLGYGAGYYDRYFSFLNNAPQCNKPKLLGLAYECQKCAEIVSEPWDVPCHAVLTESHWYGQPPESAHRKQ